MEDVNTRRRMFLSLSKLGCALQEFNSWKFHLHLTLKRVGIIATMFEKTRIHFNDDVFPAVAVVVAKASDTPGGFIRRSRRILSPAKIAIFATD